MMNVLSQSAPGPARLLAIDTACSACSVALWADGAVIASRFCEMARGHAEALLPMITEVMEEAETGFSALDLIAVTIGPGSFTGLRTGLAAARGIARARAIPLVGVTTTEAIALAARRLSADVPSRRPITVVINSRRADLYVQHFTSALEPIGEPFTALPEEIAGAVSEPGAVFAGDAAGRIKAVLGTGSGDMDLSYFPLSASDARFVAEIAINRWRSRSGDEASFPDRLLYLRAPEAVAPAEQGRRRQ